MPFNFSFSGSAVIVGSVSTTNGQSETKGWAIKRESYSNSNGSGVRTTKQKLGEAPVSQTRMYDAEGRPLLVEGSGRRAGPETRILSIEDVTEEPTQRTSGGGQ